MVKHTVRLLVPLFFVAVLGCGDVKQKQPPRIPDDPSGDDLGDGKSGDMDTGDTETVEVAKDDGPKETPEQKRQKCCQQCVAGLADDESGDPPGGIPCTKLTTQMDASCVVWFDKNPTTGKEAQECADEGKAPEEGDGATFD